MVKITFDAQSPSIGTRPESGVMKIANDEGVAPVPYVGCLTARRRNDPKQAGLSNQCPAGESANSDPAPYAECGVGIDNESDQVK